MIRVTDIHLQPGYTAEQLRAQVAHVLRLPEQRIAHIALHKRSVDARKRDAVQLIVTVDVAVKGDEATVISRAKSARVSKAAPYIYTPPGGCTCKGLRPVIVGSGPAGLFAALTLARAGVQPTVLERGRSVEERTRDVEAFRRLGVLDTASNVQFGEGGAGTFSDGKLTTGIKDVRCRYVLQSLAFADPEQPCPDLLWQNKPHVGTDRLRRIVTALSREILSLGGEVRFSAKVTDITLRDGRVCGVHVCTPQGEEDISCDTVVLAIGHSARDTVEMLHARGVPMTQKDFAVGVRIEHPRTMIDAALYGRFAGHPDLGAAPYKLVCRPQGGRGVYSFCMCPGGVVMAAASETGMVAVNGMSEYARDAENSNSALLVGVSRADFGSDHVLAGVAFQRNIERAAFAAGGGGYRAPAQLVGDFLAGRESTAFGDVAPSYLPGVTPADLRACLPPAVIDSIKMALPAFARQIAGFDRPDAVMTGVESRSSSPVRITRDEWCRSAVAGLYPCGEGAGYAGGIVSAAVDGVRVAECILARE